jgi:GAF domain-containing protein
MPTPRDDITPLYAAERAARLLIEEAGADAVVILWTTQRKRSTQFWRHQIGNAMLCNAMVMKSSEDQETATEEEDEDE